MDHSWKDESEETLLLIPGPTPVPGTVLRAQSRAMMNHRAPAFRAMLRAITSGLRGCFATATDPLILTASGTGGLEAAVVNTLSPGDRVLSVCTGAFGKRFADIAAVYGAKVERLEVEWGQAAEPAQVARQLADKGPYKAVLCTLNETSTGVVNPIEELAGIIREHGALCLVDAISGLLATPLETDAWGIDVVIAGSQKAFMIPPGLSFVTMSEAAWAAAAEARMPRYYFDLKAAAGSLAKGENPFTPAVSLLYALYDALERIEAETVEAMFARHRRMRAGVRAGIRALGCCPLAPDACASPAVTAFAPPTGLAADEIRGTLLNRYRCSLAGGQGPLKGKILRFGHLGHVQPEQVVQGIALLGLALRDHGATAEPTGAVAACREAMQA